ncbi:hypothetical protein GH733_004085 [Mirounga leonina]|nr:hypothetical protein GH733_004085 [Mirounga leonina]
MNVKLILSTEWAKFSRKQKKALAGIFQAVTSAHRHLLHSRAGLSLHLSSTGIDQKCVLANPEAVVIGSTEGIGFAMARHLAQDGAHVVISSQKQQNMDRAVAALQGEGLSVAGTVCHVRKAKDQERLVATVLEHYGGLDFLVCNAGVNPLVGSTLKASEEVWDKNFHILNVNVKSPALLLSQLLPHMENGGQGRSSWFPPLQPVYHMWTLSWELAPKDIRVNCLVPAVIETNFSQVSTPTGAAEPEIPDMCSVLCRLGKPEDCAGIVSFLGSPDAGYITGENIVGAGFSPRL